MTAWLRRNGFPEVSKHTVDRLMRDEGMNGLIRGRKTRTTIPGKDGKRAGDLLNRTSPPVPNRTWLGSVVLGWAQRNIQFASSRSSEIAGGRDASFPAQGTPGVVPLIQLDPTGQGAEGGKAHSVRHDRVNLEQHGPMTTTIIDV